MNFGVGLASPQWKGLGRTAAVSSKEPWQVCVVGTGTALGFPHPSLCRSSSIRPRGSKAVGLCPATSFPRRLDGGVVPPYGSGAVLQVLFFALSRESLLLLA